MYRTLALCLVAAQLASLGTAYTWYNVTEWGEWPDDMVFYKAKGFSNPQGICRYADWSVGRSLHGSCWTPWSGKEYAGQLPWEGLIMDPEKEILYWKVTVNPKEIEESAVVARERFHQYEPLYVCAQNDIGPGKLVITEKHQPICYVAHKGKERAYKKGFQVLMVEDPKEYQITNVEYHLDIMKVLANKPVQMAETTVRNNDNQMQVIKRTLEVTKTRTSSWDHGLGIGVKGGVRVNAGIPLFMHTKWGVGASVNYNYTIGHEVSETTHDSLEAFARVPAGHQCTLRIVAREMKIDVPYDANLRTVFLDGSASTRHITGFYSGVSVNQEEVQYEKCIPYEGH